MRKLSIPLLAFAIAAAAAVPSTAQVPDPTLEGPITGPGNHFVAATTFDLSEVGYVAEEFFISGTATAFTSATALTADGQWNDVTPGVDTAAYKTRIIVHRPIEPRRFKGTVYVEWLNVSGGLDAAPDWIAGHTEMVRSGMAWVGVSAQIVGIEGGGGIVPLHLKGVNPARYGSLVHPGDTFSYDMFSQAGQAVAGPLGTTVLGGLEPDRVIAAGESQSAFRMVTYINGVHPIADVFDGFLVHSRGGGAAALSQAPQPFIGATAGQLLRTDLNVPVLTFQTETDLTILDSIDCRQPDTGFLRLWEIAGTSHADVYTLILGLGDRGDDPSVANVIEVSSPIPGIIDCALPVNAGPQQFVLNAAVAALERWVKGKRPPAQSPLLELTTGGSPQFVRDVHGNALGGIRTPWVDVPIATLSGEGQTGGGFCGLFGTTALFDSATLSSLYSSQRAYARAYLRSMKDARRNGFLVRRDLRLIRKAVRDSAVIPE